MQESGFRIHAGATRPRMNASPRYRGFFRSRRPLEPGVGQYALESDFAEIALPLAIDIEERFEKFH